MPTAFENTRAWLEVIYFTSGPFVAIAAIVAARQLKVARGQLAAAKKDLAVRVQREAAKEAALLCHSYLNEMADPVLRARAILQLHELELFADPVVIFSKEAALNDLLVDKSEGWRSAAHTPEVQAVLNRLESIAFPFICGVADESLAFPTIGNSFCETVRGILPALAHSAPETRHRSIVQLFDKWSSRIQEQERRKDQAEVKRQQLAAKPQRILGGECQP